MFSISSTDNILFFFTHLTSKVIILKSGSEEKKDIFIDNASYA